MGNEFEKHDMPDWLFSFFEDQAKKYIAEFGLFDWQVDFEFCELEDARAQVDFNVCGRRAVMKLAKTWEGIDIPCREEVDKSAFHETLELLMADIANMAEHGYLWEMREGSRSMEADRFRHAVIRRIENRERNKNKCQ